MRTQVCRLRELADTVELGYEGAVSAVNILGLESARRDRKINGIGGTHDVDGVVEAIPGNRGTNVKGAGLVVGVAHGPSQISAVQQRGAGWVQCTHKGRVSASGPLTALGISGGNRPVIGLGRRNRPISANTGFLLVA